MKTSYLHSLGVYGYGEVEPVVLAALVTGDPLLLVGRAGTGKTFLLNSLSEALGLEHRHYNASLIAFDDLVGFPYPEPESNGIRYLETPATVWKAESVLVDEINRCKPEHQNRLFSLVHERRIQGLKLEKLRYCWAAMNPCSIEQNGSDSYTGCEPLDSALADRFAFVVTVADWEELSREDQRLVADPRGDGAISRDEGGLASFIGEAAEHFADKLREPDPLVIDYCREAATALGEGGLRISPRRVRQLVRNLLALESVSKLPRERVFQLGLRWSLPQRTGAQPPGEEVVRAAHRAAWDAVCTDGPERWLHDFHREPDLAKKIGLLLTKCECPDTGTLAVSQLLAVETSVRAATFALSVYPLLLLSDPRVNVGPEGISDLGKLANEILDFDGERVWRDPKRVPFVPTQGAKWIAEHPDFAPSAGVLKTLRGGRRERAEQLFGYLLLQKIDVDDATKVERQLNRCVDAVRSYQQKHGTFVL